MASLPKTNKKLVVQKLSSNFREAVSIEIVEMCHPKAGEVCIKNKFVGINASDINISKGRYFTDGKVPFDVGFEGIGEVVQLGPDVQNLKVGQAVAYMSSKANAYAEYSCISSQEAFAIPEAKAEFLPLLVSGLTATIGLDKAARIMPGETVLITAAAGGAGHIAVQWAKAADCHVIGTCSSEEKEKLLTDLGCDRVINYKKEDIGTVLEKEYPKGIDVVWETIGGSVFETCFKHLGLKGRIIIIGSISGYSQEENDPFSRLDLSYLPTQLLMKSASATGFLLFHYSDCFKSYMEFMTESLSSGKMRTLTDGGSSEAKFRGVESIIDAVEYLHSGKSVGKVVVQLN